MKTKTMKIDFINYKIFFIEINKKTKSIDFTKKFNLHWEDFPEFHPEEAGCISKENVSYIIFNNKNSLSIITHEIIHAVDHIFERYGFKNDDTELRAFLVGYILNRYLR